MLFFVQGKQYEITDKCRSKMVYNLMNDTLNDLGKDAVVSYLEACLNLLPVV